MSSVRIRGHIRLATVAVALVTALAGCKGGGTDAKPAAKTRAASPSASVSPSPKPELKLADDSADADAGKRIVIDVLANDVISDATGSEKSVDGQAAGTLLTVGTPPGHGTASVDGASVVYTPTAGYAGGDRFTYRVATGALSGTAVVRITVSEPTPKVTVAPAPKHTSRPATKPRTRPKTVYYQNCAAVRAAGAAPIRVGDPGYAAHLDADGDGVGCEPYSGGRSSGGTSGGTTGGSGSTYYQNCAAVRAAGAAPIHTGDPGYSRRLDRDGDGVGCE